MQHALKFTSFTSLFKKKTQLTKFKVLATMRASKATSCKTVPINHVHRITPILFNLMKITECNPHRSLVVAKDPLIKTENIAIPKSKFIDSKAFLTEPKFVNLTSGLLPGDGQNLIKFFNRIIYHAIIAVSNCAPIC